MTAIDQINIPTLGMVEQPSRNFIQEWCVWIDSPLQYFTFIASGVVSDTAAWLRKTEITSTVYMQKKKGQIRLEF